MKSGPHSGECAYGAGYWERMEGKTCCRKSCHFGWRWSGLIRLSLALGTIVACEPLEFRGVVAPLAEREGYFALRDRCRCDWMAV